MEQIYFGRVNEGEGYGYLHVKDNEASGLTGVSRGHLSGYLGGIVAFRHGNGLELHNGLGELGIRLLGENDLEELIEGSHIAEKIRKFLKHP